MLYSVDIPVGLGKKVGGGGGLGGMERGAVVGMYDCVRDE